MAGKHQKTHLDVRKNWKMSDQQKFKPYPGVNATVSYIIERS